MNVGKKLALASICAGAAAFPLPGVVPHGALDYQWQAVVSFSAAILWAGGLVCLIVRFGRAGLWFLAGAPLILHWPIFFLSMFSLIVR